MVSLNVGGTGMTLMGQKPNCLKTIKAVTWEYSFFTDAGMSRVSQKYEIHSRTRIHPGETKKLSEKIWATGSSPYQKVRPLRIEYSDGAVWLAP